MRKHTRGVIAFAAAGAAALAPVIAGPGDAAAASAAATSTAAAVPINGPVSVKPTTLYRTKTLVANRTRTIGVLGHARVPRSRVDVVRLKVYVHGTSRTTRVTVWPTGARKPAAQVSAPARRTVIKTMMVRLGSRGRINLASSTTHPLVALAVTGYVTTPNLSVSTPETPFAARRLVFNRVKNVVTKDCGGLCTGVHSTGTVRVRNTSPTATWATAVTTAGTPFVVSPRSVRVSPGATANFTVTYNGVTTTTPRVDAATLAIDTSDHKRTAVALRGIAQKSVGEPNEPSVSQILRSAYGFTGIKLGTLNENSAVYRRHPGSTEVNAPYFRAVGSTVTVRQIAKWTNSVIGGKVTGVEKTIQWAVKQSRRPRTGSTQPTAHTIATDSALLNQTILPLPGGRQITGSFRPGSNTFQFLVAGDYGDDVANVAWHSKTARWAFCGGVKASQPHPCPFGHVIKAFPLPGYANTYVLLHDDSGVNLDYNDEIWVISGVRPVQSGWAGYVK